MSTSTSTTSSRKSSFNDLKSQASENHAKLDQLLSRTGYPQAQQKIQAWRSQSHLAFAPQEGEESRFNGVKPCMGCAGGDANVTQYVPGSSNVLNYTPGAGNVAHYASGSGNVIYFTSGGNNVLNYHN
jgi:hypothetical protein